MFFKKSKIGKITNTDIQQILEDYCIDQHKISDFVTDVALNDNELTLSLKLPKSIDPERVHSQLGERLTAIGIVKMDMLVTLTHDDEKTHNHHAAQQFNPKNAHPPQKPKPLPQSTLAPHPRIRHIIAIASGKGGVGKSTTAVNIALALQRLGHKVGMLDADIYGPSLPDMLGVAGVKPAVEASEFVPIDAYGMPMISIGSLIDAETTPIAWRGIKAVGALMQLYNQTAFGHLDYLLIDMPPGTGDIALSLSQKIPITGAIIVTTPQHIALLDVKKGIELFYKTQIPIIGIVENMAMHTCSHCGHSERIFGGRDGDINNGADDGHNGQIYGVDVLGRLPLAAGICRQADRGVPSVAADDEFASYYHAIAQSIDDNINKFAKVRDDKRIF